MANEFVVKNGLIVSGSTTTSGSLIVTGSVTSTNGFTGSLTGTATTASYISPTFISASAAASGFGGGGSTNTGSFSTTGSNSFIGEQIISSSLIVTNEIKGIGNIFLQPDVNDARYFQIYNTAAPSGNDIHFKGNADFNYFGDDINYLKIDDSAQTVSIVGVNGLFVSGNIYQTGSLYVDGTITAKELHINYVTSSVLYSSGSTKFGDTSDDLHLFTGSLRTSGSVVINGDLTVNGTTTLTSTDVLRESLIISGAMAIMQAQIQAQIVSASLSMQGQVVISQQVNINIMDLGGF
jgi:cytoskeletal protein CcmA (bactofilin family)